MERQQRERSACPMRLMVLRLLLICLYPVVMMTGVGAVVMGGSTMRRGLVGHDNSADGGDMVGDVTEDKLSMASMTPHIVSSGTVRSTVASITDILESDEHKSDYSIRYDREDEEETEVSGKIAYLHIYMYTYMYHRKCTHQLQQEQEALERTHAALRPSKNKHKVGAGGSVDSLEAALAPESAQSQGLRKGNANSPTEKTTTNAISSIDNSLQSTSRFVRDISELTSRDLIWISSIEGLTAHFDMMKRFWAFAVKHERNLVVAAYKSAHYPGVKSVEVCSHFDLPVTVRCISVRRLIFDTP